MVNNLKELRKGMDIIVFNLLTGQRFIGKVKTKNKDSFLFETNFGAEYKIFSPKLPFSEDYEKYSWKIWGSDYYYEIYDLSTKESELAEIVYDYFYSNVIENYSLTPENEKITKRDIELLEMKIRVWNNKLKSMKKNFKKQL